MKIHKIIGLGLVFATAVASFAIFSTGKVSAFSSNQTDILNCVKNLQFVSYAEIDCTFTPVGQTEPTTAKFIDPHPDDPDPRCDVARQSGGCAHQMNFPETTGFFCEGERSSGSIVPGTKFYESGITIQPNNGDIDSGPLKASDASKRVKLVVNVRYQGNSSNCVYPDGYNKDNLPNNTISGIATQHIADYLQFTTAGISSLDGVSDGVLADGNWSLTSYQGPGNTLAFISGYAPNGINGCSGDIIFTSAGSNQATRYSLNNDNNLNTSEGNSDLINFLRDSTWGTPGCGQNASQRNFFGTATTFNIFGTPPSGPNNANTPAAGGGNGGGGASAASCESSFSSGFEWVMCPALDIADSAAGAFNGFIEDQLCINTGASSSAGGVTCGGNSILGDQTHQGVKNAWSIFRVLATSLLVIIMLVMVISQAIGGGPFDAYAIRKMLPKLVIAAIVIQLSWFMLKWAIDISNDAGKGIANLLFQPFGGSASMNLDTLIGTNLGTHTSGTNDTFAFFAVLGAGVGLLALSIPGLLIMALYVVLALLTAFIVLILRKLLIIMLVIFAPIALIAWILPGTQKYWKLWSDNFSKILLMFPMIVALIAAGRIFAYITAGSPPHLAVAHLGPLTVPYFGSVTSFIDLAIIIVAYFGPYFLIPQTYKWGGTAMGAIGKGVKSGMEKGAKPAKDYLDWRKGLSPWKQARAARRAKQELGAKTEFYGGLSAEGLRGRVRRARLGGIPTPTPAGIRRERALRESIVSGGAQRAEEEALKESKEALEQELGTSPEALVDHDQYVIDIALAGPRVNVHGRERSESDWRAAVEKMIQYGGPNNRVMEELHARALASGGEARVRWEKITNALATTILPKFPFIYKDNDYAVRGPSGALGDMRTTVTQLTAESFTKNGIEGEAVETILGHLSTLIREGDVGLNPAATPGQITAGAQAREHIATMYSLFNQTVSNDTTRTNINPAAARAMVAGYTGAGVAGINATRGAPGVPIIDNPVINHSIVTSPDPDLPAAITNILANIRPDGTPR